MRQGGAKVERIGEVRGLPLTGSGKSEQRVLLAALFEALYICNQYSATIEA